MATPSLGPTGGQNSFRDEVKRIFLAVCDLDPITQRKCLEALCNENPALQREVERLLENDLEESLFDTDISASSDEWIGRTLQNYRILERIGEGGMGVVYRGEDIRLKRDVVVKFLAVRMLGDTSQRERFLREAQAAAVLDHPSICTVYDIGEVDGRPYIVTAYMAGETLEDVMRRRGLSVFLATECAIQLAEGLQAAHAKGILHRDLKPSNVILAKEADGRMRATIIDFGLARVAWSTRLTQPGLLIGTATYICPELLLGQRVGEQSDVWSLGVMYYEMLAGQPPFDAENRERLFFLICNENPPPLTSVNPELPAEAARIVAKALEKDAKCRYQDASSLLEDLRGLKHARFPEAVIPVRSLPAAVIPSQPSTAPTSPPSHSKTNSKFFRNAWVLTAIALVALIFAAWFDWTRIHQPPPALAGVKRIAILPFEDLSPNDRITRINRVIGDSLSVQLASLPDVRMISDSLVRGLREKGATDHEIRSQLNLDYLVTGSTLRSEDVLQVTVNLISGGDDSVLWSKKMNLPWSDVLKVQEKFAESATREMVAKLAPPGGHFTLHTNSVDAYESYLKARFSLTQYTNLAQPEFLDAAEVRLRRALELDPDYVDAMMEMAQVRLTLLYPPRGNRDRLLVDATTWLNRAIAKDPNNPKTNSLMGSVYIERGDPLTGLAYIRKAVERAPGDGELHYQLGCSYSALGFFESALVENEKALKLDVPEWWPSYSEVWYLVVLGRIQETEKALHDLRALDSKGVATPAAEALVHLSTGNFQKARELFEAIQKDGDNFRESFEIGAALSRAAAGDTSYGTSVLKKYRTAGARKSDQLLLLAAAVGDADTMARMTRESTSFNSYGWLVRYPTFMKKMAGQQPFRKLVFELHSRWEANLLAEGRNLPVVPPVLPKPEEFLASLR